MSTNPVEAVSTKRSIPMSDGRTTSFGQKQRLVKESVIDGSSISVRLDFENGQTRLFNLPDSLMQKFAAHGAEQKLGDAIAGEKDLDDAIESIDDLIDRLTKGEWNVGRQAGGFSGTSVLLRAAMEFSGMDQEKARAWLGTKTQAEKLALRRSEQLKPIIERIESEKAAKSGTQVDTSSMLSELQGLATAPTGEPSPKAKKSVPAE